MSEIQTTPDNSKCFLSTSKKYLYQICSNKASIWNAHSLSLIYEMPIIADKETLIQPYTFAYEYGNNIFFQIGDIEYRFEPETEEVYVLLYNLVFLETSNGLCVMKNIETELHVFGHDVVFKYRTLDTFYCVRIVDNNFVLEMFRYDPQNTDRNTKASQIITGIRDNRLRAVEFSDMIINEKENKILINCGGVVRIYNMTTLELLHIIQNAHALSRKYVIAKNDNFDIVFDVVLKCWTFRFVHDPDTKFQFSDDFLLYVNKKDPNNLSIHNVEYKKCLHFECVVENAYQILDKIHFIPEARHLII